MNSIPERPSLFFEQNQLQENTDEPVGHSSFRSIAKHERHDPITIPIPKAPPEFCTRSYFSLISEKYLPYRKY